MTYPDGSPADGVKVRVKAELSPKDNVYTSELISKDGQATFEIPSIPTAAQYVWLEVSGFCFLRRRSSNRIQIPSLPSRQLTVTPIDLTQKMGLLQYIVVSYTF